MRTSKENLKSRTILTDPGGQWNGRPRERSRTGPPVGLNKEGLSGYDGAWLTGGDLRSPTSVVAVAWYAWWVVDWWLTVGGRIQVHQPASLRSLGTAWLTVFGTSHDHHLRCARWGLGSSFGMEVPIARPGLNLSRS